MQAPYSFVADDKGALVKSYDVKMFILNVANRVTFVVGKDRRVLAIQEGGDAIDPSGAVTACSLKPPKALEFVTGGSDAGH